MSWRRSCATGWALLAALGSAPAEAQGSFLPPPPLLPPLQQSLERCVPSYGDSGCAARLYAQLLCDSIGQVTPVRELEGRLQDQYERAGINFQGLTPEQVESTAVRTYVPALCPQQRGQIQKLFGVQSRS
jgi:hypothetical protein